MGRRERQRRQEKLWIAHTELPRTVAHPFYEQLSRVLEAPGFDEWVEQHVPASMRRRLRRPSLAPGRYFRLLLIGYLEGLDRERGFARRAADSLALQSFMGVGLKEMRPDHSTLSRTRRLIDVETHQAVFRSVLELLAEKDLLEGEDDRHRCHDAGGERSLALDCAARRGRGLSRVPDAAGEGIWDRDADAGAVGQTGPEACTQGIEGRLGQSAGSGGAHHEDERRTNTSGAQGRACGGSGDRSGGGGDGSGRGCGRYSDDLGDPAAGGRKHRRGRVHQ